MSIMKKGGHLVSLRAMPNGAFAKRMNLPKWKQMILGLAGRKFDKMADKYGVHYHFIFVESNGAQLQEVADLFSKLEIKPSIDTVYPFEEVNSALDKVANGRSRGKQSSALRNKKENTMSYLTTKNQFVTWQWMSGSEKV